MKIQTQLPRALSSFLVALILAAGPLSAQVILDPTGTVIGTVGLSGEVFGSGSVYHNTGQTSISGSVNAAAGTYSVPVSAGKVYGFNLTLSNFADTNAAQLSYNVYNQPAIAEGATATLDLHRSSGQILGKVSVNAGATIQSMTLRTFATDSSVPVNYNGYVTSYPATPGMALQPFPAIVNAQAYATVVIRLASGCTKSVNLPTKLFNVVADATTTVEWPEIDMEGVACPTGNVEGVFELSSLEELGAQLTQTRVHLNGPASFNMIANPAFQFLNVPTGTYYSYSYNFFSAPYYQLYRSVPSTLVVQEDQTTVYNTTLPVGAIRVPVATNGTWNLGATASANSNVAFNNSSEGSSGSSYDPMLNDGGFDFIVPEGEARVSNQQFSFFSNLNGRYRSQSVNVSFFIAGAPKGNVSAGQITELEPVIHQTSEAPVIFQARSQPGQAEPILARIVISGFADIANEASQIVKRAYLNADARNLTAQTQSPTIAVDLRGLAGSYNLSATAYDTAGRVYTATFPLTLGVPGNTQPGTDVSQELEDASGNPLASVTFANVTGAGTTTISQVGTGPSAPANFAIFKSKGVNGNTGQFYYDIVTTATFEGEVLVCLHYDDSGLSAGQEAALEMGHYIEESGQWEVLEQPPGSPDTVANIICGFTDSFSLFAALVPDDIDGDGVFDSADNCIDVPNPDQLDTDGDGIGNACETDTDGDGIDDDTDLCPLVPSADNGDRDGDGIGDICDDDRDGDGWTNAEDNCPDVANLNQFDYDYDGIGDACDDDADSDGVAGADDICPLTPLDAAVDENGCSSAQLLALACPEDGEYRNHGEYVSCIAQEAEKQVSSGLITKDEKGAIVSKAARSDVGKKK